MPKKILERKRVKSKAIASVLGMCILIAAVSTSLALYAQPTREAPRNTEENNLNVNKTADNDEQKKETSNQPETGNPQEDLPKYADALLEIDSEEKSQKQPPLPMPDGRIFLDFEPPYAYTPTCTPKEPMIPLLPLEPE